ncbi:MAG: ankyrin repeat domain-containing protein [Bdellovibrionales bacterium]|nr:ankyrin repeat domain-containing protein [Bdellovibrionales bacterium]
MGEYIKYKTFFLILILKIGVFNIALGQDFSSKSPNSYDMNLCTTAARQLSNQGKISLLENQQYIKCIQFLSKYKSSDSLVLNLDQQETMIRERMRIYEDFFILCLSGDLKKIKYLVKTEQIIPDLVDKEGETALMNAAKNGRLEVVKFLTKNGFDVAFTSVNQETVLTKAIENGYFDVVDYLIKNNFFHLDQLLDAVEYVKSSARQKYINTITPMIYQIEDFQSRDHMQRTLLMKVARTGSLDLVKFLIQKGSKANDRDLEHTTVLMFAVRSGELEVVKFLVEQGAWFFLKDLSGNTAEFYADHMRYDHIVEYLRSLDKKK